MAQRLKRLKLKMQKLCELCSTFEMLKADCMSIIISLQRTACNSTYNIHFTTKI